MELTNKKLLLKNSNILLLNYFTTKLYFFNVLHILYMLKNKKLYLNRNSRSKDFYGTKVFVFKYYNGNYIYSKALKLFSLKQHTPRKFRAFSMLEKNNFNTSVANVSFRNLENINF